MVRRADLVRRPAPWLQVRLAGLTLSCRRLLLPLVARALVWRALAWLLALTERQRCAARLFLRRGSGRKRGSRWGPLRGSSGPACTG